jgi:HAD superfamily hydrolase (TIGR01458 family)
MVDGLLLDIDGVLTVSWSPLDGAVQTIRWLRDREVNFRLVTNSSSKSRREIAALLADAGMPIPEERILTAVTSAARYLAQSHSGAPCLILNEGDTGEDLKGIRLADALSADVVLLGGAGPSIGYRELNEVFRLALDDVPVVALHRNARYQTAEGPALDMGAFIVGIEAATGTEIPVVGKPAPAFFDSALADLGTEAGNAIMVGDDIGSDVLGAQEAGITGVLVRTGKFRPSDLEGPGPAPDHVIDGIGALPALLEGLRDEGDSGPASVRPSAPQDARYRGARYRGAWQG